MQTLTSVHSADGTSLTVDVSGDGESVVLVCGAATNRTMNAALAAQLSTQFRVFNYDRRGRGDSGDSSPYAIEREFEDLQAIIDLAGGSAAVFGSSSGGVLALRAAGSGVAASRLVLWEPPIDAGDGQRQPPLPADYAAHTHQLAQQGRNDELVAYFMTAAVGMPAEMVDGMRDAPFWADTELLAATIAYDAVVSGDGGVPPEAAAVRVATLILDGGSTPWMAAGADALATTLELGTRKTLPGQTHNFDPTVLAPSIAAYLAAPQP